MKEQIKKSKTIKILLTAYIFSFILLICASYLTDYITYSDIMKPLTKVITSSLFVIISLIGYRNRPQKGYRKYVLIAVFLCFLGDFLLGINFLSSINFFAFGLLSFLLAHIFFIIGLRRFSKFHLYELIAPLGTSLLVFLLSKTSLMDFGSSLIIILIYGLFVGFLASISIENLRYQKNNKCIVTFSIGGILFFVSDWILMVKIFGTGTFPGVEFWALLVYYIAMIFISLAFGMGDDGLE